jgi:hypothetical protein
MSDSEWLACDDPDLLLEVVEGRVPRPQLVEFVRRCWLRVAANMPVNVERTVVDEYVALAHVMDDHDAVLYASEAALKAAKWAPVLRQEQKRQAALLRQIVGRPPARQQPS